MPKPAKTTREDRLKAALKANMGRRKAQARARAEDDTPGQGEGGGTQATAQEKDDKTDG